MLQCEYCDYFKSSSKCNSGNMEEFFICEFSEHIFDLNKSHTLTDYPCRDISYEDYLKRMENSPNLFIVSNSEPDLVN